MEIAILIVLVFLLGITIGVIGTDNNVKRRSRKYREVLNQFLDEKEQNKSIELLHRKYIN